MPIKPENRAKYPKNWDDISSAAKWRAGWRCMHPGCTARQYEAGLWEGEIWKAQAEPAETYSQARQNAADLQFSNYGDDPGAPKFIVIVLTTMHLDHDPKNCDPDNLRPACQRHHLRYDEQHHKESAYMTRMTKRGNLELPLA